MSDEGEVIRNCKVCSTRLAPPYKFCSECKSYQDWRAPLAGVQIPLALLTALISVITSGMTAGSWLLYHQSHTSATVASDTTAAIFIYVWNTGRNPSAVVKCTLRYSGSRVDDHPVTIDAQSSLISAEGHSIFKIAPVEKPTWPDIRSAAVLLTVQESNGARDLPPLTLSDEFMRQTGDR